MAHIKRQRAPTALVVLTAFTLLFVSACQSSQTSDRSGTMQGEMSSRILSDYGALRGVTGGRRRGRHPAIDFGAAYGSPILAAADGTVMQTIPKKSGCGLGIVIRHSGFTPELFTIYCHAKSIPPHIYKKVEVKRGDIIGQVGTTGLSSNVPHVHFVVRSEWTKTGPLGADGDMSGTEDPMRYLVGCFSPTTEYPSDKLVFTAPVDCGGSVNATTN